MGNCYDDVHLSVIHDLVPRSFRHSEANASKLQKILLLVINNKIQYSIQSCEPPGNSTTDVCRALRRRMSINTTGIAFHALLLPSKYDYIMLRVLC